MCLRDEGSIVALLTVLLFAGAPGLAGAEGSAAPAPANPDPWPRHLSLTSAKAEAKVTVYQPQVESWKDNKLSFRTAVASKAAGAKDEIFGVVWGTARTQVDRSTRTVTLTDFDLTRSNFPTLPDKGAALTGEIEAQLRSTVQTIALDRLEASLSAANAGTGRGLAVRNDPPRIFVSDTPAVLIPIAGAPVWRHVHGTDFERVLNTRAAILRKKKSDTSYLHVYDGWLVATGLEGPWKVSADTPGDLDAVVRDLEKKGKVDLVTGGKTKPPPSLAKGAPKIFVSEKPAELIVFKGQPNLEPIDSTSLLWASNTTADVIVDTRDNAYYVLLAGRWYTSASLDGPWRYVSSTKLPGDFKKIPPGSPAGLVLASVAGTTQAQEALIANSIPQTAVVSLVEGPAYTASYDGKPQLDAIPGTKLQQVINAEAPTIRVSENSWYALQAGVWFVAPSANGPWVIATRVPDVIYTIPPSSPLHYVTYVRIYDANVEVVDIGYTPGYLGTVVASDGVVVYGTGYDYQPWVGEVYYAAPPTWDVMAQPVYNPAVGWSYGFAMGLTTAAMVDSWGAPIYYTSYYHGYGCCASASANVYGHWGNTVTSGTRTWYSDPSGTMGEKSKGSYTNNRTGTTGTYNTNRSVNPYTGQAERGYHRSFDTAGGTTGNVSRQGSYDAQTGQRNYDSNMSAQGPGGSSVSRSVDASDGPGGPSVDRSTTVDNARTGQTNTYSSGGGGGDHYAGADGNVYRGDGSGGWQSQGAGGGWQDASGNNDWANREQQARSQGQSRMNGGGFGGQGGFGSRGGFGGGDGGGFGGRGGGFGGGGFGGRFGGGGFGGRGGGRR